MDKKTSLILEQAVYAKRGNETYYVYPIWPSKETLAKLCLVDDNLEEVGKCFRIPIAELLESYSLFDINNRELWSPDDYGFEEKTSKKKIRMKVREAYTRLSPDEASILQQTKYALDNTDNKMYSVRFEDPQYSDIEVYLTEVDDNLNEVNGIPLTFYNSDLFEDFTLMDEDGEVIWDSAEK